VGTIPEFPPVDQRIEHMNFSWRCQPGRWGHGIPVLSEVDPVTGPEINPHRHS
jgi:hypothetical protein